MCVLPSEGETCAQQDVTSGRGESKYVEKGVMHKKERQGKRKKEKILVK